MKALETVMDLSKITDSHRPTFRCDMCLFWDNKDRMIYIRKPHGVKGRTTTEYVLVYNCGMCKTLKCHTMCYETCNAWRLRRNLL